MAYVLIPLAVVLVIWFALYVGRARESLRIETNEFRYLRAAKTERDKLMRDWLGRHLADTRFGIDEAVLFGAITHDYATNDVDVVIILSSSGLPDVQQRLRALLDVEREFRRTFALPLQIQKFLAEEKTDFEAFLNRQATPIPLFKAATDTHEQRPSSPDY